MQGAVAEGVVPQLLRDIYVGRRNGWLHLSRGEERQSLRFRRGHIVNARTNVVSERMGEVMVRHGMLSQENLDRATEVVIRERRRLGEVLSDLGLVDAGQLEDAVALHVHELLAKVFSWKDGTYAFEDETETAGLDLTLKLSTGELILEAVQAVRDPDAVRAALGEMDRVPAPSSDPLLRFQKLTLSPADGFVLSRVDGATSAREIVQMIPLPAEEVERSLFGLLSTGVIEYTTARRGAAGPEPARPATPEGSHDGRAARPEAAPRFDAAPEPEAAPEAEHEHEAAPEHEAMPAPATAAPDPHPSEPAAQAAAAPEPPMGAADATPPESEEAAAKRREINEVHAGLRTRNHFELLGIPRTATESDVKEAYFRLAKRFHPDVHHGSSLSDLHKELEEVFAKLGEAYEVLRDRSKRADYEERIGRARPATPASGTPVARAATVAQASRPAAPAERDAEEDARVAEDAIRRASRLYEKAEQPSEYWDAIQLLEPVVPKAPGKLRTKGEVLLARCYLKNPKWSRRAEETLLAATRRDPAAADAWALLGGIYAGKGMHNRALSMYRKALELRPEHEEAARYVAEHGGTPEEAQPRPPEGGGGLLRRLFRRS